MKPRWPFSPLKIFWDEGNPEKLPHVCALSPKLKHGLASFISCPSKSLHSILDCITGQRDWTRPSGKLYPKLRRKDNQPLCSQAVFFLPVLMSGEFACVPLSQCAPYHPMSRAMLWRRGVSLRCYVTNLNHHRAPRPAPVTHLVLAQWHFPKLVCNIWLAFYIPLKPFLFWVNNSC